MRADKGALVTLDTGVHLPFRYVDSDAAFFVSSSAAREGAVCIISEGTYRQLVTLELVHRYEQLVNKFVAGCSFSSSVASLSPACRNFNSYDSIDALVDSSIVHVDNVLALLAIGMLNSILQVFNSICQRNNISQLEECRLHNHIDAAAQTNFLSNLYSINDVEFNIVLCNIAFELTRQLSVELFRLPVAVQQEGAAFFQTSGYIIFMNIGLIVYSHEISSINQIRCHNRGMTETQMGNGYAAGFFTIIGEVALRIHIRVVTDDFDSALVSANSTIAAQAPELAALGAGRSYINACYARQRGVGYVISDADGEVVFRLCACQIVENSYDIARQQILGAQAITATDNHRLAVACIEGSTYIKIQRFAKGARLFGAVQHSDTFYALRNCAHKMLDAERTVQMNYEHANLSAFSVKLLYNSADGFRSRAHDDDDILCILCAIIVEQVIFTTGQLADFAHVVLYDFRQSIIIGVNSLASLEVNIWVLCSAADNRIIRVQATFTEGINCVLIEQLFQISIIHNLNLLDFVRGTEAVEEVQERNTALDSTQMCHACQVHNLLYAALSQQSKAGLTCSHNVLVVTKDRQRACCQRTCRNVEYSRQQLASHFIHIRNHQEQALRCGISSSQRTCLQRAVNCAGGTSLRLHFHQLYCLSKDILFTLGSPFVNNLSHRRRRGNRINCGYISESVRDIRSSCVAVHSFHFYHRIPFFLKNIANFFDQIKSSKRKMLAQLVYTIYSLL